MHPLRRLRVALPDEAGRWLAAHGGDLARAWRGCPRPEWLLRMSLAVGLERPRLVHASADLAAEALATRPVADPRPRQALAVALRWVAGRADGSEAWALGFAASQVADGAPGPAAEAIRAAACTAFACDRDADAAFYAHRAYAARAAAHAARALGDPTRAATIVRARIPAARFLAAFERASRPPPPLCGGETQRPASDSFYC
jgi:hypothetical protein